MLINNKKKLLKLIANNKDFEGALFVYDFKLNKITAVNDALVRLFGYDSKDDFQNSVHHKITNLISSKSLDRINDYYNKGINYFTINFSFFNKENIKRSGALIANILPGEELLYGLIIDVTNQIKMINQLENNFLEDSTNKRLVIRSLLSNFESVVKIDLDNFQSSNIFIDREDVLEQSLAVDWNDYYRFVLNLMSESDANKLENFATKEALIEMVKEGIGYKVETFTSAFNIKSAAKNDKAISYKLIVEVLQTNDKKHAFLIIEAEDKENVANGSFNLVSAFSADYSSVFIIDEDTNQILARNTSNRFRAYFEGKESLDFDYAMENYANTYVFEEDRVFFKKAILNGKLFETLKDKPSYIINFRRVLDGYVDTAMFYFIKAKENDKNEIIMAVRTASNDSYASEYQSHAEIDSLTELLTYSRFIKILDKKIIENDYKGFVIRFDIDHFSKYNNLFGVAAGDKILAKVGNNLNLLSKDYDTINSRLSGDIFLVYINSDEDILKEYINKLQYNLSKMSQFFDFIITVGVYRVQNNGMTARDMVDGAALAANTIKNNYDKTYVIYDNGIRESVIARTSQLTSTVKALKEDKLYSYFRPIYNNDLVVGYDYNIKLEDMKFNIDNLYQYLDDNGLSIAVNKRGQSEIIDAAANNNLKFVIYLTKHFFLKHGEVDNLIEQIDKNHIDHNKICLSLSPSIVYEDENVAMRIAKIRDLDIDVMFDYTNYPSFDFKAIYECKINCMKFDFTNIDKKSEFAKLSLNGLISMAVSGQFKIYIAKISDAHLNQLKTQMNLWYTKDDNKIYTLEQLKEKK